MQVLLENTAEAVKLQTWEEAFGSLHDHLPVLSLPFLYAPQTSTSNQTACTSTSPVSSWETCR